MNMMSITQMAKQINVYMGMQGIQLLNILPIDAPLTSLKVQSLTLFT